MPIYAAIYRIGYDKNANKVTFQATFSRSLKLLYVGEMLKRVGKMWAYGGHYHSFVTYINAIFRIYI